LWRIYKKGPTKDPDQKKEDIKKNKDSKTWKKVLKVGRQEKKPKMKISLQRFLHTIPN
jgi:hypothetical protein